MTSDPKNPLGMVPDPYAGDTRILPDTPCTHERRLWFRRANEIMAFLFVTEFAQKECQSKYETLIKQNQLKLETQFRLRSSDGRLATMPTGKFIGICRDGLDILSRQGFIMFYGSLETYLFELIERSYVEIGITKDILYKSLGIMMKRNWDGKFCKMSEVFSLGYNASNIVNHFKGFEMEFNGKAYEHPLLFLDELSKVRHKIVHASSIMENGKLIYFKPQEMFLARYGFCALLTEYIDALFVRRFSYQQTIINPGRA